MCFKRVNIMNPYNSDTLHYMYLRLSRISIAVVWGYQTNSCGQCQINVLKFMNTIIKYLLTITEDKIKDETGSS